MFTGIPNYQHFEVYDNVNESWLASSYYSRICLSRHLKRNRKSGDLGKQQINMLRPTQTLDPFVSAEAEHLRNKEHRKDFLDCCTTT